jgi:hypothetical protein
MDAGLFPEDKEAGHGVDHPPPSIAEAKERELYFCIPFVPSWPVLGRALPYLKTYLISSWIQR